MTIDPTTRQDWQDAANLAEFWLLLHSAKLYGLITGGPDVDADRCQEILHKAARLGINPNAQPPGKRR